MPHRRRPLGGAAVTAQGQAFLEMVYTPPYVMPSRLCLSPIVPLRFALQYSRRVREDC